MKMVKIIIALWALFLVLILVIAGCSSNNTQTADEESGAGSADIDAGTAQQAPYEQQITVTEEVITDEPDLPICGDGNCEEAELGTCDEDCPSCDDNDACTADSFDLATLSCKNVKASDCCGDGICAPGEDCDEDCPTRRLTLASYPYPFVHGDDLEADIVVGDEGTQKEISAATAIALGLGETTYATLASDISTIKNTNIILIGNPCTNVFVAELMPYSNDCKEDYEAGEGRLALFVTGESGGKDTYALVVSGYSDDDTLRAAQILESYEKNMPKLKGATSMV